MALWDFIVQHLFPLFGTVPETVLEDLQSCFWCVLGLCTFHFLIVVPYKGLLALIRYRKWSKG